MPKMILAKCKVRAQNELYNNPISEPQCTCSSCVDNPPHSPKNPCDCSGCLPENITPPARPARQSTVNAAIPKNKRLSKLQKAHGLERLIQFRLEIWRNSNRTKQWMFPPSVFLSDTIIASILDNYILLDSVDKISVFIRSSRYLDGYAPRTLEVLRELKPQFAAIAAARKAENAANLKLKKAQELLAAAADSEDEDGDVIMTDTFVQGLRSVQFHLSCQADVHLQRCDGHSDKLPSPAGTRQPGSKVCDARIVQSSINLTG
jgi:hypothetical protein